MTITDLDYRDLVRDDRVHGSLYYDPRVLRDEIERIWRRDWVFVGHDSEIPEPGDYVRKRVALSDVVLCRDRDGVVRVFVNWCPHRGNLLCASDRGNTRSFRCAYHGWTFANTGKFLGRTLRDGYRDGFGKSDVRLLTPEVATYRGLVFVRFEAGGPTLDEKMAAIRAPLDAYLDRSPTGRVRVLGVQKIRFRANWKVVMENFIDGYHPSFVHRTVFYNQARYVGDTRDEAVKAFERGESAFVSLPFGSAWADYGATRANVGNGRVPLPADAQERYEQALVRGHGEDRARELLGRSVPVGLIFPNLFFIQNDFRTFQPVSVRETDLHLMFFALEDVDDEVNEERLRYHQLMYGPAGFVLADDLDVYERAQTGVESAAGGPDEWLDISRGMHRERVDDGTRAGTLDDEVALRGAWRHYRDLMTAPSAVPA